jgi:hypothetical protein
MTPLEFVESVEGFSGMSYAEQVRRFCWHVAIQQQKPKFAGADISACFDATGLPKPSSVSPFLTSLASQKPPFLIKKNGSFELSRHARELFDSVLGKRDTTVAVDKLLQELPDKLKIEAEKVFLEEAITCFRHGAFRAAIVMTWNLAYNHLCKVILNDGKLLADFNTQLPKSFAKKAHLSPISKREDFEELKESEALQIAKSAGIITDNLHKILKEKLDRRNMAAHPSTVVISKLQAEDFIHDLVVNVLLRL